MAGGEAAGAARGAGHAVRDGASGLNGSVALDGSASGSASGSAGGSSTGASQASGGASHK
jgi:hypothetical protein